MSDSHPGTSPDIEPLEDRVDSLFRELELAVKWQRPSVLFAVYSSEYVRAEAEAALEHKLIDLGQKVFHFQVKNEKEADIAAQLSKVAQSDRTVFFVAGLRRGGGADGLRSYAALNKYREYFIDNRFRLVFWLTENEAVDLAHHAPDYWAFRHRVIEFVDSMKPEHVLIHALESAWQGSGQSADTPEVIDAKISLHASLLTDLPQVEGANTMNANLYLTLGILHWRRSDYDKASKFLQTALETAITIEDKWFEAECLNAIALVYSDLGRVDDAIEAYKQAIHLAPNQILPWNNLGNLFSRLDRKDEALSAFRTAIEYNPEDAVSWNGLGNVYFKMKQGDDAVAAYKKAIELAPGFVHPWNGLGNVYTQAGRFEEAIEAYRKAIKLNNRLMNPWIGLGGILARQGQDEEAIQAYQKALEINPQNAREWNSLGNLYVKTGAHDKALAAYQQAIKLAPEYGWPYSNLGWSFYRQGKYADAVPLFRKGITLLKGDKEKAVSWIRLGDAYRRLEDEDNAVAAFQTALELDADCAALEKVPDETLPGRDELSAPQGAGSRRVPDTAAGSLEEPGEPGSDPVDMGWNAGELPADPGAAGKGEPVPAHNRVEEPTREMDGWLRALENENGYSPYETAAADKDGPDKALRADVYGLQQLEGAASSPAGAADPLAPAAGPEAGQAEGGALQDANPVKSANEWNELGHALLKAGSYDEAIAAYIKAIETAPELSWPYIHNLALAHCHKGEHKGSAGVVPEAGRQAAPSSGQSSGETEAVAENAPQPAAAVDGTALQEPAPLEQDGYAGDWLKGTQPGEGLDSPFWTLEAEEGTERLGEWLEQVELEDTPGQSSSSTSGGSFLDEALREQVDHLESTAEVPGAGPESAAGDHKAAAQEAEEPDDTLVTRRLQPVDNDGAGEPKNAREWNALGNIHLKAGACDRAIAAYERAIALEPKLGWPYSNLGLAYSHKGKYEQAVLLYRKSLELLKSKKEKSVSWNRLGDAYRRLNDHDNATAAYQKAEALDSKSNSLLQRVRLSLLGNAQT